ncbi:MAG: methylthioadenosine phosphorylase [Candidatus Aminicenantes bacterium RBG_16_63_16]|nr:MAG: methylthioadenosine phosphorylase [Candidatus Aminicenantes bacterium RBG_16_63_16]
MAGTDTQENPYSEIGILGGTGLYEIDGLRDIRERSLETPFGSPSDAYITGTLEGKRVAFLSRHGRGHRLLPMDINYRANIYGFKMLGVERIISVNSCGSLQPELHPRDIVFSDQFFDRTRRLNTFFGGGIAAHIGFADPVCPELINVLFAEGQELGLRVHKGGAYLCIEGPAFSTKAESNIYRHWGCEVIGMTAATEAKLAREAEICYATMNLVTDYDVWHAEEAPVTVEMILENLRLNIENAKSVVKKAVAAIPAGRGEKCGCGRALAGTIVTREDLIPADVRDRLRLIIGKYLKE